MSYKTHIEKVTGKKEMNLMLFTLSTCIWCKKTKALLDDLEVTYQFIDVDLLDTDDQNEAYNDMGKNKSNTFPTTVFNDGEKVIMGFKEEEIRELCK